MTKPGVVKSVKCADLKETFFVRKKLDEDNVIQLAELYEAGVQIAPIDVVEETMEIVDGRHRLAALQMLNREVAAVKFVPKGTKAELIIRAFQANYGGPKPPTKDDIQFTIEQLIEQGYSMVKITDQLPFPKSLVRRYVSDVQSALRKRKVSSATNAVIEGSMTVPAAAKHYEVDEEDLKGVLSGKRKKRLGIGEIKGTITGRFRSTSMQNANVVKKAFDGYDDGILSEKRVKEILDHIEDCIGQMAKSHRGWLKRFETKVKGEETKDIKTA